MSGISEEWIPRRGITESKALCMIVFDRYCQIFLHTAKYTPTTFMWECQQRRFSLLSMFCPSAKSPHVIFICIYVKNEIEHFYILKNLISNSFLRNYYKVDCSEVKIYSICQLYEDPSSLIARKKYLHHHKPHDSSITQYTLMLWFLCACPSLPLPRS